MPKHNYPVVAIIGKPNAGKSTLFNCLLEKRKALVSRIPGTTRDRNYGQCLWRGKKFILADTGGVGKGDSPAMEKEIRKQAEIAIKEARLVLFVIDIREGTLPEDRQLAGYLRKSRKPAILVLNKADSPKLRKLSTDPEFLKLGLDISVISAVSGAGTGDLLDEIVSRLPKPGAKEPLPSPEPLAKIAIIGKPNAGKSSFLNAILGEERVIVSPTAHTTRESQDALITYKEKPLLLVDTAGVRRKAKIDSFLERKGVGYSLEEIRKSDVVLLFLEADTPVSSQDKRLAGYAEDSERGIVIVVNKWDLVPDKSEKTISKYSRYFQLSFPFLKWAPIIFISAKNGQRVRKVLDLALETYGQCHKEISQEDLKKLVNYINRAQKQSKVSLASLRQTGTNPQEFTARFARSKKPLPPFYLNYLEKKLRENFGFEGAPIRILTDKEKP